MAKCSIHPSRVAANSVFGKSYCQICIDGQQAAIEDVKQHNKHVEPKECFITWKGSKWEAFSGTGCAHWVAHQRNISRGAPSNMCLKGCSIRVPDVISGKQQTTDLKNVRVNDIWANNGATHCGLVSKVDTDKTGKINISITHDTNRQGGVRTNDFGTFFHAEGKFYR